MVLDIPVDSEKKLAIKIGDTVGFNTPLYKGKEQSEERIEVATILGIHPKTIFHHLKKNVGDVVSQGDIIALKESFFSHKTINSHLNGIITEIDHVEGVVLVETQKNTAKEYCWFAGEIVGTTKKTVQVKIGKHEKVEAKYVQRDFGGTVWGEYPVGVFERASEYDVAKLEALGGRGIITTYKYEGHTLLPKAEFKLKNTYEEIVKKQYSYCFASTEHSTIIFYSL